MPSRLQLEQEQVWLDQFVPPNMTDLLIKPLRIHFGLGPNEVGAPGDENHLRGRHRSRNWDLTSRWCTDPSYGTQDARDRRGDGDWYRALDVGISGPTLWAACHRVDALVRAGHLPGLAEWFGTFDGRTVVGWYQGHESSSDASHLTHGHFGLWTEFANDPATLRLLLAAITGGDDMPLTPADAKLVAGTTLGSLLGSSGPTVAVALQSGYGQILALVAEAAADKTRDAAVLAAVQALATAGGVDSAPIVAAINAAAEASRTQVAALQAKVEDLEARLSAAAHAEADALDG
jgi:hypothetical protein